MKSRYLGGYQDKTLKNSVYIGSSVTVNEINYCKIFKRLYAVGTVA